MAHKQPYCVELEEEEEDTQRPPSAVVQVYLFQIPTG